MNDREFIISVQKELIDLPLQFHKLLFAEAGTHPYGQEAMELYATLDETGKETFFKIIRHVMVEAASNLFGIFDGVAQLEKQSGDFVLQLAGQRLSGTLQDLFLEIEETD